MVRSMGPTLRVVFYRTAAGREPVRDWLRGLDREDRKVIGEDVKTWRSPAAAPPSCDEETEDGRKAPG